MLGRLLVACARIALSAFAGLAIYAAYEPTGMWFAQPLGIALVIAALLDWGAERPAPGPWWGAGIVFIQGLVTYLLYLPWIGVYVGALPWIALSVIQALYSLALGAGIVWLLRARRKSGPGGALYFYLGIPLWFVAIEYVRSHWPFGGFAWTRLAWGQVGGPLVYLARLGGPALVTFAVAAVGVSLIGCVLRRSLTATGTATRTERSGARKSERAGEPAPRQWRSSVAVIGLVAIATGVMYFQVKEDNSTPTSTPETDSAQSGAAVGAADKDHLTIAAIQGNVPRLGLDFNSQRRAVLLNHVNETYALANRVKSGQAKQPDIVLWPENSSDVDPFIDDTARADIESAAKEIGAPIIFGTLTHPGDQERNTVIVWDPNQGPGDRHDKVFLQPFGEYMPFRDLLRHVSSYVDMAGNFSPGHDNGVVTATAATTGQSVKIGVATCYEVAFDQAFENSVKGGAQILTVPTNNATFGFTDMSYQQLAMSRLRAVEYDRSTVVAATSGVSAIIGSDGQVHSRTEIFRPGILEETLPLRSNLTPAARAGAWGEIIAVIVAVGFVGVAVASARNKKSAKQKKKYSRGEQKSTRKCRLKRAY